MEQLGSHWTDSHKSLRFRMFRKSLERVQVFENTARITGTLHEDLRKFMIISLLNLHRMRHISDKCGREDQNTHFISKNVFPQIVPFMR